MSKKIQKVPFSHVVRRIFSIKKNLLNEIESFHEIYGDVFGIEVDNLKCFIRRPDLIKQVLVEDHMNYEKSVGFRLFQNVIGLGLLTSDGDKWIKERKVLNLEFTRHNQENVAKVVQEKLEKLKSEWDKKESINFTKEMNELTMETICRILFNYELTDEKEEIRTWFKDYDSFIGRQQKSFIKLPLWFPLPHLIRAKKAVIGLRSFAKRLMDESLSSEEPNMIKRMKENGFSNNTICDHILTFFIAGHETTANSINFTLLLLRDNPLVMEKLVDEINGASSDQATELEYLDLVIKESLRLFPTIPLFPRIVKKDNQLGEFEVQQGDMIAFSPWIMHRCSKYWENPKLFQPERFIGKNPEREFIYFPFGGGPRKCIGAALSSYQMKNILFFILKNYNFSIDGPVTEDFNHNVSLSPARDIYLKFLSK